MRFITAAAVLLTFAPAAIAAEPVETKQVPVDKAFPFLAQYYGLAANARDRFRLDFFQVGDPLPAAFRMVLKRKSGDAPVTVAPDRRFLPVPTAQDVAAKVPLEISAAKGTKIAITVKLSSTVTPAKVMDAAPLAAGLEQVRAGTKSMAGMMSFLIPNYQSVCFDGAKSGTATLAGGKTVALKLAKKDGDAAKGSACYTPSEMKGATQITLDRVPSGVYISPKPY